MRVIAGQFRGRKLLAPEGDVTRPITDRVKQSLFDILSPMIADSYVYDCFAGTGSMGLECLSRGATHVTFFEADRSAASRLRRNIETITMQNRTAVITRDLFSWFGEAGNARSNHKADLIFLDPPYRFLREKPDALIGLAEQFRLHHLSDEGIVIFRHDAADTLELPALPVADIRNYGSMTLEFLRKSTTPAPGSDTNE